MGARTQPLPRVLSAPTSARRRFPGWRWVMVAFALPVAGYVGWEIGGRVDSVANALVGGALTAAGFGAVQWWAANDALGRPTPWIAASAIGYAVGLAAGAAIVGYDTELGDLALMGLISGAVLGVTQALVLAPQRRGRLAVRWAAAMPVMFALGWSASTAIGVDIDAQYTVFGAAGAALFMVLSGLLLARFTDPGSRRSS